MNVSVLRTPGMARTLSLSRREQVVVVLAHDLHQQVERAARRRRRSRPRGSTAIVSATPRRSPSIFRPIIASRRNPSVSGSVTATICIDAGLDEPLHPLAHRGLGEPDRVASFVYGSRPSCWSCSMIALSTSSITTAVLRSARLAGLGVACSAPSRQSATGSTARCKGFRRSEPRFCGIPGSRPLGRYGSRRRDRVGQRVDGLVTTLEAVRRRASRGCGGAGRRRRRSGSARRPAGTSKPAGAASTLSRTALIVPSPASARRARRRRRRARAARSTLSPSVGERRAGSARPLDEDAIAAPAGGRSISRDEVGDA